MGGEDEDVQIKKQSEMSKIITGIGEILWDVLPSGKVLGGAPANFAYHASRYGAEGWAVSAVGDDALGDELIREVSSRKLNTILAVSGKPTGVVKVSLGDDGVPSYEIMEDVAWDNIPFNEEIRSLARKTDAVCFGSLLQRAGSRATLMQFLHSMKPGALKVFDINLRQHYYSREVIDESLEVADILKLNNEEIGVLAGIFGLADDELTACRTLIRTYDLELIILTRGGDGSWIITEDSVLERSADKVDVVDTVGAGDAFTAAFVVAYLDGESVEKCHELASEAASYVCSRKGAMPE